MLVSPDKFQYEVVYADNTNVRLTVTPTRCTLKLVRGLSPADELRVICFSGDVAGDMLAKGVTQTWRGKIKLKGVLHSTKRVLAVAMYLGENRKQYWYHTEKTQ